MRRIISLILTSLVVCVFCVPSSVMAEGHIDEQRTINEMEANRQYQCLLENLEDSTLNSRHLADEYYGGAYLDEEGNLVVCITRDDSAVKDEVRYYTGNDQIDIITVEHTYDALSLEQEHIWESIDVERNQQELEISCIENDLTQGSVINMINSIQGSYVDEERNALVVEMAELNDDKIELFKQYISNEYFILFEPGYTNITTAEWKPGRTIYSKSGSLSTGYPVYFTNSNGQQVRGFITAGHGFGVGDIVYRSAGSKNQLGICVASAFSGENDAALIQITSSSYSMSGTTYYGGTDLSSSRYTLPAQNSTIYKEGMKSGQTSGKVISTNAQVKYGNVTISNILQTTVLNLSGDSGGVAYTSSGNVVGSMSGSTYSGNELTESTFIYSYISKVNNATSTLGCSIWE